MVGTPCLVLGAQLVKRVLSGLVVYKNIDNLAAAVVIDAEKCQSRSIGTGLVPFVGFGYSRHGLEQAIHQFSASRARILNGSGHVRDGVSAKQARTLSRKGKV